MPRVAPAAPGTQVDVNELHAVAEQGLVVRTVPRADRNDEASSAAAGLSVTDYLADVPADAARMGRSEHRVNQDAHLGARRASVEEQRALARAGHVTDQLAHRASAKEPRNYR